MNILSIQDLDHALALFSPYNRAFICADGGCLCEPCTRKEHALISANIAESCDKAWQVVGVDAVEEDNGETCDHCYRNLYNG
jgi:hypothetical protein